jgi:hypothetical protein
MRFPAGRFRKLRGEISSESGMTVWEVTVATFILLLGILATFQMFDAATRNTYRSEQTQVALDRAQREMEKIRALAYDEVLLTGAPSSSTAPNDPRGRVSGATFNASRTGNDPAPLAYNGGTGFPTGTLAGGLVPEGPESFTSGDVSGKVFRFVVWRNDPTCSSAVCPGTQDYKEAIVVVKLDDAAISYQRPYVELHTRITDPDDSVISDLPPGGGNTVTAQQFWLSDTPCENDGSTQRIVPLANHLLHNTLGTCFNGAHTGATPGAPDALLRTSPPDTDPGDPGLPQPYDYSDDAYLEPTPDGSDRGIQLLRQDANGCNYAPTGTNAEAKIHRWVSDPLPEAFTMSGRTVIEFFTRAINDANHTGSLCFYLFRRSESGGSPPIATDTRILNSTTLNPYFIYTPGSGGHWPRNAWTKVRFEMRYGSVTVGSGERLGLAVSVERQNTSADALQVVFEHHIYPTRIEVDTTTPLG